MTAEQALPERSRIVAEHLAAAGVDTRVVVLPDSARTAAEAARAVGCPVGAIANSLVLTADGDPVLVMTSGAHRVDFTALSAALGAAEVAMAPAAIVREVTGQAIGGVAPVGTRSRCARTSTRTCGSTRRSGRRRAHRTRSCLSPTSSCAP
ncbi:YbaK/EbsC family protein [Microbacterium sp. KUDC0406]|uniref:YbaK/EbsC family protein n=1 Tax=Microbacterium sp. KUDC0406 TaxID=2909588 RepID=UPI002E3266D4|nr:YbaK/EbsC family protein [Microbacterium sp. KUDC0406]